MFQKILAKGMFPRELPPPFTTVEFAKWAAPKRTRPPAGWRTGHKGGFANHARAVHYSHRRVGMLRRRLGLPHPALFFHLARVVAGGWPRIHNFLNTGRLSQSRPVTVLPSLRAFAAVTPRRQATALIARTRQHGKYLLKTDIASFFPSIYTHSIPWALYGKATAKANINKSALLGNRLDYWCRMCQDRQTVGIPIGPDTSWIISEIVLRGIEGELTSRIGVPVGFSVVDDYELVFKSYAAAEQGLSAIEASFAEFELSLNQYKTRILDLPQPLDTMWASELSGFEFRGTAGRQRTDILRYFSRAYEFVRDNPDDFVLKYAVARLSNIVVHRSNWDVLEPILVHCVGVEPGCFQFVLERLATLRRAGWRINNGSWSEVISQIITEHAPLGHSAEVAWSLWASIFLNVTIDATATSSLGSMIDSTVALLALDADGRGCLGGTLDRSNWAALMTTDNLWREHWLLAYEANIKGWLPSAVGADHVASDPCFRLLKRDRVSFYDSTSIWMAPVPLVTVGPGSVIL